MTANPSPDPTDLDPTDLDPTDLERALRAYAPPVRPPEPAGGDVRYVLEDTAVGRLLLAARPDGRLLTCRYVPDDARAETVLETLARRVSPRVLRGGRPLDPARRELAEFLAGTRRTFQVPVDLALATPFQHRVLTALDEVGYGRTTSYGELARTIGAPTAARAVGGALGSNPLCIVLPCHRVLGGSGELAGYAGGPEAKRRLLELEAVAR